MWLNYSASSDKTSPKVWQVCGRTYLEDDKICQRTQNNNRHLRCMKDSTFGFRSKVQVSMVIRVKSRIHKAVKT